MLGRASHLERVGRWLARQEQELQVRLACELVTRIRSLTRAIIEIDLELERRAGRPRRRCSSCPAAVLSPRRSCSPRSARSTVSKATRNLPGTAALRRSRRAQAASNDTGSTAAANRQLNSALYRIAITQARYHPGARAYLERKQAEAKAGAKPSAASNDSSSASSSTP
jgi:transposase